MGADDDGTPTSSSQRKSPLPNLKVPNCFGKDFDVGQQMEKAKEQTLSMFTKTKAAFSKGVNTVDQALFKDNGGTAAADTDEKLLPAKTELSNGTAKPEETPSSGGGTRGIYVVTLLLLVAALGIVFAMRVRSEGGLAHDATAIREFVEATTENLVEDIQEEDAAAEMCEDGLLVPGPKKTRVNAGIFVFLLLWSFVGVAIAADVFMVAIEYITSSEVTKTVEVNGVKRTFTVQVWNATVANLTLMALGSSAPEILLSVIEIVSSGFFAGELGPLDHRRLGGLQPARHLRGLHRRHPRRREPHHQRHWRLLHHGHLLGLRLPVARRHPAVQHAQHCRRVGGLPHLRLLPHPRLPRLPRRHGRLLVQGGWLLPHALLQPKEAQRPRARAGRHARRRLGRRRGGGARRLPHQGGQPVARAERRLAPPQGRPREGDGRGAARSQAGDPTFASKQSATSEPYADNSIGNVTGSNSVNVFLGLGMPWAIAAIYWTHFQTPATVEQWKTRYRAGFDWYSESMPVGFAVPAGDLSFSVAVFAACAVTCLSCIILRRQCVGMELGGPPCSKYGLAFFFVLLWFTYIGVSSASSYGLLAGLL